MYTEGVSSAHLSLQEMEVFQNLAIVNITHKHLPILKHTIQQ